VRQKKDKILIVALSSLILFSSSLALMMYIKSTEVKVQPVEEKVVVYVTNGQLDQGTQIKAEDIQKKVIPKSYVSFSTLMPEEIVGKYAKVAFLPQEPFRAEKLSLIKEELKRVTNVVRSKADEQKRDLVISNDSVSLSLNLFKNIDYSLKSGDYIDIVTVKNDKKGFKTTYVALHVKILSFSNMGSTLSTYQIFRTTDKKKERVVADTIVLDMPPRDIKNLLIAYYSSQELNSKRVYTSKNNAGHLWIIKTDSLVDNKKQAAKKSLLLDKKIVYTKRVAKKRRATQKVLISYEK
jgi:Flp pilus assembly protein CpaB